jgi:peptide/nickel transport system ATP-binding protein
MATAAAASLLEIEDLSVAIPGEDGVVQALDAVALTVATGEVVGLVGESGGGKSMIARAVIRLLPERARASGRLAVNGRDVFALSGEALRDHRGRGAALCFQTPRASLSPTRTVGRQIADRLLAHGELGEDGARAKGLALFAEVGLNPERQFDRFPHELSGGMCQRVMIALALACNTRLLIADEPTTGLDVTLTGEILKLIAAQAVPGERGVLIISHDLAALSKVCDRVVVLEAGHVVEAGRTARILGAPAHPYTRKLVAAVPDIAKARGDSEPEAARETAPLLSVRDLEVVHRARFGGKGVRALRGISFDVFPGETLAVVGESGSGKSTLSRAIMGLLRPSAGSITFEGTDISHLPRKAIRKLRRRMQMVFQDPVDALNPRMSVENIVSDPLRLIDMPADERSRAIDKALDDVGLSSQFRTRRPHELSGGQAQRVGLARALVIDPAMVVLDEPTSALDVTIQAQILDLIRHLTRRRDRAYIMVSHDLAIVRAVCDRVMVISDGEMCEFGPTEAIFSRPASPVTKALLAAAPRLTPAAPHSMTASQGILHAD